MAPISGPNQGRAQAILGSGVLFLVLPIPFVLMRLWARRLKKTALSFNDYAIVLALMFTTGYNVNSIISSVRGGYGQHIWTLTLDELETNQKNILASTFLWPTANTLIKISVLHFYKKIFRSQKVSYAIYVVGSLSMAYWLATVITAFALCRPFEYNWNKFIPGECGDVIGYYLSTAIANLIIDVMIIALPLPVLWGLQMDTRKKVSLTFIFSLGALICIISIVRCYSIATLDLSDVTYNVVLDNITTSLEPTLGVINACLPLLQPVAKQIPGMPVISWLRSLKSIKTSERRLQTTGESYSNGQEHYSNKIYSTKKSSDRFLRLSADEYPLHDVDRSRATVTTDVTVTEDEQRGQAKPLGGRYGF